MFQSDGIYSAATYIEPGKADSKDGYWTGELMAELLMLLSYTEAVEANLALMEVCAPRHLVVRISPLNN